MLEAGEGVGRQGGRGMKMRVRDIDVQFAAAGEGSPVVLVHGLAQVHQSWEHQLRHLKGSRVYAYDVRGHGQTSLGNAAGSLGQLGDDLIGFLEQVGPSHLVGFSLGGTIAAWAAGARPDLVRSAVLLGTSSVVGKAAAAFYRERVALVRSGDRAALEEAMLEDMKAFVHRPADLQKLKDRCMKAVGDGSGYANAAAAMARVHEQPLTPVLAGIRCPVLVVGGEYDTVCPRKAADILLSQLPQGTYEQVAGVGHLMAVDDAEAVTAVIQRHIDALKIPQA